MSINMHTSYKQLVMTKLIKAKTLAIPKLSEVGHGRINSPQMFYSRTAPKHFLKITRNTHDGALFSVMF